MTESQEAFEETAALYKEDITKTEYGRYIQEHLNLAFFWFERGRDSRIADIDELIEEKNAQEERAEDAEGELKEAKEKLSCSVSVGYEGADKKVYGDYDSVCVVKDLIHSVESLTKENLSLKEKLKEKEAEKPLTVAMLSDALSCFWNASLNATHDLGDETATAVVSGIANGFDAIANRLEELNRE